jgi:hypothetical protein
MTSGNIDPVVREYAAQARSYDRTLRLANRAFYRTYRQKECAALIRAAGFRDVTIERYKISWLWGLMTAVMKNR